MKTFYFKILLVTIIFFLLASCSSVYEKVYPSLTDGKYDSEFPYNNASEKLEEIGNCIRLLNSIAFYTGYIFGDESNYILDDMKKIEYEKTAIEKVYFNRTASGTATVIYCDPERIGLLSVAHIVNFPDTIISYFVDKNGNKTKFVQSISIKSNQSNYVPDLPRGGKLDIIEIDAKQDIALLGMKITQTESLNIPIFDYPWGKSSELEWGSFVYVFGFPMNYKMISKGIVSLTNKESATFLIDAVFNRGYSGGIVLAVRDGVPNFELVGLVKSVPADIEYTVRPLVRDHDMDYNPLIPYKGEVYVDKSQVLRVGITKVIGIEQVIEFIKKNKENFSSKGYYFKEYYPLPSMRLKTTK